MFGTTTRCGSASSSSSSSSVSSSSSSSSSTSSSSSSESSSSSAISPNDDFNQVSPTPETRRWVQDPAYNINVYDTDSAPTVSGNQLVLSTAGAEESR